MNELLSLTKKRFSSDASIAELHLSIRSTNVLLNNNIHTVGELYELIRTDKKRFHAFKNLGKKSEEEIYSVLDNIIILGVDNNSYSDFLSNYNFSKRALSVFSNRNITTISELKKFSILEIKNWKNVGKQTLDEIIDVLSTVQIPESSELEKNATTQQGKKKHELLILKTNIQKDCSADSNSISNYQFSTRTLNILQNHNIQSIAELRAYPIEKIKTWRNLGSKTLDEIIDVLSQYSETPKEDINIAICVSDKEFKFYKIPIDEFHEIEKQSFSSDTQFIKKFEQYKKNTYVDSTNLDILFVLNNFKRSKTFKFSEKFVKEYNSFYYNLRHSITSILVCIIKCVKLEKLSTEDILNYHPTFCKLACSDSKCIEIAKSLIFDSLRQRKEPIEEAELFKLFPDFLTKSGIFSSVLIEMENESLIKKQRNSYEVIRPSVSSYIKNVSDKKIKDILTRKIIKGQTLEEIGQIHNVSRERIRQLINKYFIKKTQEIIFAEDEYAYVYQKYRFTKDQAKLIFGEITSNYFQTKYSSLDNDLEDCLDDKTIPANIRRKIRTKIIYSNYIYVGNQYVKKYRPDLYRYYIKRYCTKEIEVDDFIKNYRDFWEKQGLPKELYDMDVRTVQNKMCHQNCILYKYPRTLRFYDFEKYDYTELLEVLNLDQYENVSISTSKFFKNYPKLMKKYDIHDEYELHNILRSLLENKDNNITFHRMPGIEFGKADVEAQVINLLTEYAPISPEKLANIYEEKYGVQADTVRGTLFNCISKYLHRSIYTIDLPHLEESEYNFLKQQLTDDFYTVSEIKNIFIKKYKNIDHINPMTLKELGFLVNENYVIKLEYGSASSYFKYLLTKDEKVSLKDIKIEIKHLQNFYSVLTDLLDNYELLEYEKGSYINFTKFLSIGIRKEDFVDFCKRVNELELPEYFGLKQIKESGFNHKLFDLGFEDWFYECILTRNDMLFSNQQMAGKIILSKGTKDITWVSMIEDMISEQGMDIFKLSDKLYKDFNIQADKSYILSRIADSDLYYDKIMEKIYRSYDDYFEEI